MSLRMPGKNCIANYLKTYTLLTASEGPEYFDHCFIEGTTDFIFGNATLYGDPYYPKREQKIIL